MILEGGGGGVGGCELPRWGSMVCFQLSRTQFMDYIFFLIWCPPDGWHPRQLPLTHMSTTSPVVYRENPSNMEMGKGHNGNVE